jgi:hypothetical protein
MPIAHVHLLSMSISRMVTWWESVPRAAPLRLKNLPPRGRRGSSSAGLSIEVVPEHLRQLRALAVQYQQEIDELIGAN